MSPQLYPFTRLLHPPAGTTTERLPVTRDGVGRVPAGQLVATEGPCFATLRITAVDGGQSSFGLCGLLPATCFLDGTVRPHEQTLRSRLERQEKMVVEDEGALGKPVLLTVPSFRGWWGARKGSYSPLAGRVVFNGNNNRYVQERLRPRRGAEKSLSLAGLGTLCIADGHHRAATHALLCRRGRVDCRFVPVCLIGADELTIGVFARVIVADHPPATVLERLREWGTVRRIDRPGAPSAPGEWLLHHGGNFYLLDARDACAAAATLPVRYLDDRVLPSVFGIHDARADERIVFEPVAEPTAGGLDFPFPPDRVTLIGHPLPRADFFAEAAAGRLLPPKSTRFEPRVPSGLVVHPGALPG